MYKIHLAELLKLTKELLQKAGRIDSKMENNEDGQLEQLQVLFDKRKNSIEALAIFIEPEEFRWTAEDREQIQELKILEESLQMLITDLYQTFGDQLKRINQTKQMSKKYIGAYQNMSAGGSFIDKRK